MKFVDGWVERESFPGKNKSACQEETGIGCNCLSESECMALGACPRIRRGRAHGACMVSARREEEVMR
jgi:hypothetical protein